MSQRNDLSGKGQKKAKEFKKWKSTSDRTPKKNKQLQLTENCNRSYFSWPLQPAKTGLTGLCYGPASCARWLPFRPLNCSSSSRQKQAIAQLASVAAALGKIFTSARVIARLRARMHTNAPQCSALVRAYTQVYKSAGGQPSAFLAKAFKAQLEMHGGIFYSGAYTVIKKQPSNKEIISNPVWTTFSALV